MKNTKKNYVQFVLIAAIVILIDQVTKYLVRTNLALKEVWIPFEKFGSFFRIIHWKNTGIAFGLFQNHGWLFTAVGIVIVLAIIVVYGKVVNESLWWRISFGLELGGAIGNMLDRINPKVGYVVDFIWIGNFPVFNFADMSIVIGAIILIAELWNSENSNKNKVVIDEKNKSNSVKEQ